ncbi:uncharacterized protein PFL1_03892 [Pseudozyma flocculosa PF-1]|uniref:CNNM transmembrane domain-containing protein n=1 Tax=Pseudozyma flocculosa PF-1 TaxID=1277687 RepID=A0A061H818_9BASI|nr:uncharacterized protein PFL1_03892 [Pseudozyma flocculosa PF-1]EPQ28589.1 hypothetical protein PFL1_03892 [Pseudozyma flocculosa PF-1]
MAEPVAKYDPDPAHLCLGPSPSRTRAHRRRTTRAKRTSPFSLASLGLVALILVSLLAPAVVSRHIDTAAPAASGPLNLRSSSNSHHHKHQDDRQIDARSTDGPAGLSSHLNELLSDSFAASQDGHFDLASIERLLEGLSDARAQAGHTPTVPTPSGHGQASLTKRAEAASDTCHCGESELSAGQKAAYGILVPILVVLSGLFAGLTLGYMSLDETQLQVLSLQGTPEQKRYAEKIMPIRKDGHLLLTTLLIANMITNETLPIIADPLLGGGVQAVIVSIVLVVIFAELIPQSVCSRYGLAIGAKMAVVTRFVLILLWPIAYPVSRVLHWTLGPHHGIVYRRAELKELVNMHAATGGRGDLNTDTVTIVGGALDLQEKVVKQAMTPIDKVFMIPLEAKLDYHMLQEIVGSGHSRIPVYHEIEIPVGRMRSGTATPSKGGGGGFLSTLSRKTSSGTAINPNASGNDDLKSSVDTGDATIASGNGGDTIMTTIKKKKIIGTLLVKQCVLLDPEDSVPVKDMVINAVPTVPADEPLLNLLNVFQEGRSHLAIVSSRTRRGSPGSFLSLGNNDAGAPAKAGVTRTATAARIDDLGPIDEEKQLSRSEIKGSRWSRHLRRALHRDEEHVAPELADGSIDVTHVASEMAQRDVPIGIITLEDVLEELIGEEILDEYDSEVEQNFAKISPPPSPDQKPAQPSEATVHKVKEDDFVLPSPSVRSPAPKASGGVLQRLKLSRNNSVKEAPAPTPTFFDDVPKESPVEEVPVAAGLPSDATTAAQDAKADSADAAGAVSAADPVQKVRIGEQTVINDDRPSARSSMTSTLGRKEVEGGNGGGAGRMAKPVIIRHQPPGGTPSTAIVSEALLRGRGSGVDGQERSRSATPSGQSRAKIFKSSPIVAPGAAASGPPRRQRGMSRDASSGRRGTLLAQESTSASAPSTPVVDSRPDEDEADDEGDEKKAGE